MSCRNYLTSEQKEILQCLLAEGMTTLKRKDLVQKAVEKSGLDQRSKLTVVRLSRTTKIRLGQPDCMKWLPLGQPKVFVKT